MTLFRISSRSARAEGGRERASYLREQQARTELARINRELKQLCAQLAALGERRAALLSELGEQGSPRQ